MSFNQHYEYEDEPSIDPKLLCSICLNPFTNPRRTSCGHIFCHSCIQTWFEQSASCPLCRKFLLNKHCKSSVDVSILRRLDQLLVKCSACRETEIKRRDFPDHLENRCPKGIVSCSTAKCSWKGQREDFKSHQSFCPHRKPLVHQTTANKLSLNFHLFKIKNLFHHSSANSHICLRHQNLTDQHMPMIIQAAVRNKQCRILDLGQNKILAPGIRQLAESLEENSTLKVLSLHQNSLAEISVLYLAEKLSFNNSALTWLDLEATSLTDTSAEYLATMLMSNTSLTGLWLSKNRIGFHGVKMLTSALISSNRTLKYLDLEQNFSIDDSSLNCFIGLIEQNRSLNILYINNCQLSGISRAKLRETADARPNFRLVV